MSRHDRVPGQPAWIVRFQAQGGPVGNARARKIPARLVEDEDYQLRHERVAGTGIAKAKADVCTRLPPARDGGRRASRAGEVPATTADVLALAGRLKADRVELASWRPREITGDCGTTSWKRRA